MSKSQSCIFYMLLANRFEKINCWFSKALGVAVNIWNELDQCMVYRNLHSKFAVSSFYYNWDLCVQVDEQTKKQAGKINRKFEDIFPTIFYNLNVF